MKKITLLCAACALTACQTSQIPMLGKALPNAATATKAQASPMRPTGPAFEVSLPAKVTDFASCTSQGVVIAASQPAQCVYDGVTYAAGAAPSS